MLSNSKKTFSYVTVLCNDAYFPGVVAIASSLRKSKSKYKLSVLIQNTVSSKCVEKIRRIADVVVMKNEFDMPRELLIDNTSDYQKWNNTFFKLNAARLTQYKKIVLLDADMIVRKNIDELFECPNISCTSAGELISGRVSSEMNSGLMVLEPSEQLYQKLIDAIVLTKKSLGNRPFGDQDVFRYVFAEWPNHIGMKLPEIYNCYATDIDELIRKKLIGYSEIKVIHYAMVKPWIVSKLYPLQVINMDLKLKHAIKCFYKIKTYLIWWHNYWQGLNQIKKYEGYEEYEEDDV